MQQHKFKYYAGSDYGELAGDSMRSITLALVLWYLAQIGLPWPGPGAASVGVTTPTFVQGTNCPNSNTTDGTGTSYICQLPELTLANNLLVVGTIVDATGWSTLTVTTIDSAGATVDTMTQVITNSTVNNNVQRIYKVSTVGGAKAIKLTFNATPAGGFIAVSVGEYYNVSTTASGTAVCNRVSATSVTAGNITVGNGDLLVNTMFPDDSTASGAQTAGSGMTFAVTDRNDSEAMQYRLGTGGAINPTITQGTSHATGSCAAGFTAAAGTGTAPSTAFRVLRLSHDQMPVGEANPNIVQVPVAGNLAVVQMQSGGDTITGITDSASNTWSCNTGATNGTNGSQTCYSLITTPSNSLALSITRTGTTHDATFMVYDINGATAFDASTTMTGTTATLPGSLTTCTSCFTPAQSNELIFASSGWDFCTATTSSAPVGSLFNSATSTVRSVDGPQPVDQNNGWSMYRNPNTSAISVTWTMNCTGTIGSGIGQWAGSIVAFK